MGLFFEKYISFLIGIITMILLFMYTKIEYQLNQEFIKQFTTIGTCTFGFLLTLFGLIIQGDNQIINKMRKRHVPFVRFVNVNKKVVILSFLLTLYAYFVGYIDLAKVVDNSNIYKEILLKGITCLFYGGFVCVVTETIYFLLIFYLLIQGKNENNDDSIK